MVNYYVMYEWGRNKRRTASEKEVGEVSVNLKALIDRQSYYPEMDRIKTLPRNRIKEIAL